jgi:IS5 family transposase
MKQMTFADAEYADKRKQTRKKLFLIEMDQVGPWKDCRLFLVCLG